MALIITSGGCSHEQPAPRVVASLGPAAGRTISPEVERRVVAFCGDCHALPRPESFARDRWHFEVRRGYEFYAKSGRTDLDPPPLHDTLAYFRSRAPRQIAYPQPDEPTGEIPFRFSPERFDLPPEAAALPEIASLRWAQLAAGDRPVLLASDMRYGHVIAVDLQRQGRRSPRVLAQLRNPARLAVCDLNADGLTDLAISDLGSYLPAEHDRGRVVVLLGRPESRSYEPMEFLSGSGRVADVQPVDADQDGRLDLIVAEFGWRDTGRVLWGRNVTRGAGKLEFEWEEIDDRPGAIDLRPHDFTGDGRPDFVCMFSQEYESIELFRNRVHQRSTPRQAAFARQHLWSAPDLTFGSSGIELVDLNADGRTDILSTNGDAFDNDYVSPWHGVQWFENRSPEDGIRFVRHRLTDMPGAYRAVPGDFDQDGRLDIVAVARLPSRREPVELRSVPLASIILLQQLQPGQFRRFVLESGSPHYPTVVVADFDQDGDSDFAVAPGPYSADERRARNERHYLTVWWNESG